MVVTRACAPLGIHEWEVRQGYTNQLGECRGRSDEEGRASSTPGPPRGLSFGSAAVGAERVELAAQGVEVVLQRRGVAVRLRRRDVRVEVGLERLDIGVEGVDLGGEVRV